MQTSTYLSSDECEHSYPGEYMLSAHAFPWYAITVCILTISYKLTHMPHKQCSVRTELLLALHTKVAHQPVNNVEYGGDVKWKNI